MTKTHTLIANRITFDDTNYTPFLVAGSQSDIILTAVMAANTTAGALTFTLALVPTGTAASSSYDVKITSVPATSTANLIDGFELPVPANHTLYLKCSSATGSSAFAFGMEGSEGTIGVKAVLGS